MATDSLDFNEEQMTLYVKTLSGDIYMISCPMDMAPGDFPFQVLPYLPSPRPPVYNLRLFPAYMVEQGQGQEQEQGQEEKLHQPFYFPIHFRDGDVFYLFVESPQLEITIQFEDYASLSFPDSEDRKDDMEVYRLQVNASNGDPLIDHLFYTLVYPVYAGSTHPRKYYTNIYYHEDDIDVIYNPSLATRIHEGIYERDIRLLSGATAFESPSFFANMCLIPSYITYLCDNIHEKWMDHVRATGMPELQPYLSPTDEEDLYGPFHHE